MVKQKKLSPLKICKKNLQVYWLEVHGLIGGEILIWQTIGVCGKGFLKYYKVSLEPGSVDIVSDKKAYCKYLLPIWSFRVGVAG